MAAKLKIVTLSLIGFIEVLLSKRWTKKQIAGKIGVSELQVHYYHNGTTKTPNPQVCKNILDKIKIDGHQVLVSLYDSVEDLEEHLEVYSARRSK